jgi:geranylgeranyl transferase type-2 subunit beta
MPWISLIYLALSTVRSLPPIHVIQIYHHPLLASVIVSLQQPSGVFAGDSFGEIDTRFLYCAVNSLSLLGQLDKIDVGKAVGYIEQCKNFDGGFGSRIGAESHAAQGSTFVNDGNTSCAHSL